ncbi:ABC transporter ATP-binding protein [bacterium]|nr:ABC transporter ATP-binding protein [bacterium]
MTNVIEIKGLHKSYRRRRGTTVAVDGLDLEVPEGGVYGFLGPNGSGKTTTIRCLLGLAQPTEGTLRLLGQPVPSGLRDAIRRIGAIVETPALFPTMTASENLRLLASMDGIGHRSVDDVLEVVGLTERADDLVKRYSLGMKQRLALAAALLKDPELLILDEPANGLDPAGMREVRQLLRRLADDGRTVFVSSHILAEIESTCDRVAILANGRLITHGTVDEVTSTAGHRSSILVKVADLDAGKRVLRGAGLAVEHAEGALRVDVPPDSAGDITRLLAGADQWVTELRPDRYSLEDVFLELTEAASEASGDNDDSAKPTAQLEEVTS